MLLKSTSRHLEKASKVAEAGSVQATANTEKTVFISPLFGVFSFATGLVLVAIGISKK